jgi:hypothetical protein
MAHRHIVDRIVLPDARSLMNADRAEVPGSCHNVRHLLPREHGLRDVGAQLCLFPLPASTFGASDRLRRPSPQTPCRATLGESSGSYLLGPALERASVHHARGRRATGTRVLTQPSQVEQFRRAER